MCSICLDSFRCPKLLPCQHTFCKRCIRSHQKQNGDKEFSIFKCPICRTALSIPEHGIRGFCDNYFVSNLRPDNVCDECSVMEEITECSICDTYLCYTCKPSHKCKTRNKITRSPRIRLFDDPFFYDSDSDYDIEETNSISSDDSNESIPFELRDLGCKTIYKVTKQLTIVHDLTMDSDLIVSSIFPISSNIMGFTLFGDQRVYRYNNEGSPLSPIEVIEERSDISFGPCGEMYITIPQNEALIKHHGGSTSLISTSGFMSYRVVALNDGRLVLLGKQNIGPFLISILSKDYEIMKRIKTQLNQHPVGFSASANTERICITAEGCTAIHIYDFSGNFTNNFDLNRLSEEFEDVRPMSVCCDNEGNFLIIEGVSNAVLVLSPNGYLTGMIVSERYRYPFSIAVDSRNRIWIGDSEDGNISVYYTEEYYNIFDHPNNIQRQMGVIPRSRARFRTTTHHGRVFDFP